MKEYYRQLFMESRKYSLSSVSFITWRWIKHQIQTQRSHPHFRQGKKGKSHRTEKSCSLWREARKTKCHIISAYLLENPCNTVAQITSPSWNIQLSWQSYLTTGGNRWVNAPYSIAEAAKQVKQDEFSFSPTQVIGKVQPTNPTW